MKKLILPLIPIAIMIMGVWTFLFGCGDTLPHNIADASDDDLCMVLRVYIDEYKIPEWDVPADEDLSALSEEERTFYILSVFDSLFQCGGLTGYIINTDGVYLDEIAPLLRQLDLDQMADVYEEYFQNHDLNLSDFQDDEADLEVLTQRYSIAAFDDDFYACYEASNLTEILADYGRMHLVEEYQKRIHE